MPTYKGVTHEHDNLGLLEGWPQRIVIRDDGLEVDTKLLAWIAHRIKQSTPRWEFAEVMHEVWLVSVDLAAKFDSSRAKIETFLVNYVAHRVLREYSRQFRMGGCINRPLGDGVGWVSAFGDCGDDSFSVDGTVDPPEIHDPAYAEIVDVLLSDCSPNERKAVENRLGGRSDWVLAMEGCRAKSAVWNSHKRAIQKMKKVAEEIGVTSERLW